MYQIDFTKQAIKDLKNIPKDYAVTIIEKLKQLAINPYSAKFDIKKLKGAENAYRIRIGVYRVIYEIENKRLLITVMTIQSRGNIYG